MSFVLIGGCSCAKENPELVTITDYTEGDKGYYFLLSATRTEPDKDGIEQPVKGREVTLQFYIKEDWKERYQGSFRVYIYPKAYFELTEEQRDHLTDRLDIRMDEEIAKDDGRSTDTILQELLQDAEFAPYAPVDAEQTYIDEGRQYEYTISSIGTDIGFVVSGLRLNEPRVNIEGDNYSQFFEMSIDGGEFAEASAANIKKSYDDSILITLRVKDNKYEIPNTIYYYQDGKYWVGEDRVYCDYSKFIYEDGWSNVGNLSVEQTINTRQYIIGEENPDGTITFEITNLHSDIYVAFTTHDNNISEVLTKKVAVTVAYDYDSIFFGVVDSVTGYFNDHSPNFLMGRDGEICVYMELEGEVSIWTTNIGGTQYYYNIDAVQLVVKNAAGEILTGMIKERSKPVGEPHPMGTSGRYVRMIRFTIDGDKITEDLYVTIENVKFHDDDFTIKEIDNLGLKAMTIVNNTQDPFYPWFNTSEYKNVVKYAGKYYVSNAVECSLTFDFLEEGITYDFASAVTITNASGTITHSIVVSDPLPLGEGKVQYTVTYSFTVGDTEATFTINGL